MLSEHMETEPRGKFTLEYLSHVNSIYLAILLCVYVCVLNGDELVVIRAEHLALLYRPNHIQFTEK